MAERFNLTAQIQLQAPRNTAQVIGDIRKQLSGITANVQIKGDARTLAKINKEMQGVDKSSKSASKSVGNLNKNLSEAARRFSVITVATGTMIALARAIKNAVGEAIAFERELIKISQVTGKTVSQLQGLSDEVTRLATSLGASSADLLNVARVLNQAGFAAEKTKQALDILAKTSLGATFNNIQDTTEGAIAVLRQFGDEARLAGGDIKFLEQTMDAINSVSKKFAVESGDLITVIRRVGGVFASAGGSVNELIALFTSVRATTRESAETISTGLRTIFTRIQRTDTVDQLAALGIQLRDSQGQFVGAYEAVRRLSQGLSGLNPKDFRFSEIVESLGGFRQIGKVIPLIQQFTTAQDALNVAQSSSGSVARDAVTAQQSLAVQAAKVKEEFSALIRKLTDSSTFRSVAKGALEMASAFIRIVEALEPLLPLITSLIALKIGSALAPGLGALTGIGPKRKAAGGRIQGFARGGFVPGSGNRDTVPAMLQPGEFVIKQSSAKKLGAGTLESMNQNRFAGGIKVPKPPKEVDRGVAVADELRQTSGRTPLTAGKKALQAGKDGAEGSIRLLSNEAQAELNSEVGNYGGAFLRPEARDQKLQGLLKPGAIKKGIQQNKDISSIKLLAKKLRDEKLAKTITKEIEEIEEIAQKKGSGFVLHAGSLEAEKSKNLEGIIIGGVTDTVEKGASAIGGVFGNKISGAKPSEVAGILKSANIDNVTGNIFEGIITSIGAKTPFSGRDSSADFDYPTGLGSDVAGLFGLGNVQSEATDAKSSFTGDNVKSFNKKVKNFETKKSLDELIGKLAPRLGEIEKGLQNAFKGFAGGDKEKFKGVAGVGPEDKDPRGAVKNIVGKSRFKAQKAATGGKIDTVPALLTPGEYVINKSAAQSIGYSNLNTMNKTGAQKFATGGAVGVQRFSDGGSPVAAGDFGVTKAKDLAIVNAAAKKNADAFNTLTARIEGFDPSEARAALVHFARNFDEAADEAASLDAAVEAAHSSATEFGEGAERVGKKGTRKNEAHVVSGPSVKDRLRGVADERKQAKAHIGIALKGASGDEEGDLKKNMAHYSNLLKTGVEHQEALNQVMGKLETTEKQSLAAKAKGLAGKAVGKAKQGVAGVAGVAKGAQGAAQSAQQLAFMATVAGGAAIQMSGLSDASKQAATETLGFVAALVAGGATALDMLGSLADISKVSAVAEGVEAGATTAVVAPLLILIGSIVAVIAVLKYFQASAKAEADALSKGLKETLDNISSGEGGSTDKAKSDISGIISAQEEADKFGGAMTGAGIAAGIGGASIATAGVVAAAGATGVAASAAAAGAAMGSVVPIVGTLIGALAGAAIGYYLLSASQEAAVAAQNRLIGGLFDSIDTFENLAKSGARFDTAMKDLDKKFFADTKSGKEDRIREEASIAGGLSGEGVGDEFAKLGEIAAMAGVNISQLSEESLTEEFGENSAELIAFQVATRASTKGMENLAKKVEATQSVFQKAAQLEITGLGPTFDQLINGTSQLAGAFKAANKAIKEETAAKVAAADQAIRAAQKQIQRGEVDGDQGTVDRGVAALDEANVRRAEAMKRGTKQQEDLIESGRRMDEAKREEVAATQAAAAAAHALAVQIRATADFMKELTGIQFAQGQESKDLDNRTAVLSGGDLDFSRDIEGLQGDPTQIRDPKQFTDDMDLAISELPAGLQKEARRQVKLVTQATDVFNEGKKRVTEQFAGAQSVTGEFGDKQIKEIISAAGLNPDELEDSGLLKGIMSDIREKAQDGISDAEFGEIFSPIAEAAGAAQEGLKKTNEIRNADLANYKKHLNGMWAVRDADLKSRQKQQEVFQKGAKLRAEARGKPLSSRAKERARTDSAQLALSGTGVRAGDSLAAAQKLRDAKLQHKAIQRQLKSQTLSAVRLRELAVEEKNAQDTIKKTTAELERLANQTDKAADIMSEIDKEKSKRDTVTGLIQDFVVGGNEERGKMVAAFQSVNKAISTGTLQNQSPEQRQATVGLLDKLGDIEIPGTGGMTGKEVKQELVFRDAIQMGLDPAIAEKLARATTKEQQLIDSLDRLTQEMQRAATGQAVAEITTPAFNAQGGPVQYRAGGGVVYANEGTLVNFQPKGTDTVPAMLTPGEFVIKKSSVDKYGSGMMQNINAGNFADGGVVTPVYRDGGGSIDALGRKDFLNQLKTAANNFNFLGVSDPDETAILGLFNSRTNRDYVAHKLEIDSENSRYVPTKPYFKIKDDVPNIFEKMKASFTGDQITAFNNSLEKHGWLTEIPNSYVDRSPKRKAAAQKETAQQKAAKAAKAEQAKYVTISSPTQADPDGKLIKLQNPFERDREQNRFAFDFWQSRQKEYVDAYNEKLKARREPARIAAEEKAAEAAAQQKRRDNSARLIEEFEPSIDGPRRDSPGYDPSIHSPAARRKEADARAKEKAQKEENINAERSIKAAELDTPGGESGQGQGEKASTNQERLAKRIRQIKERKARQKKAKDAKDAKAAAAPQIASATYPTSAEGIFQTPRGISAPNLAKFLKENLQHDEALAYIKAYKAAGENPSKISGDKLNPFKESEAQLIMTGQPVRDSKTLNGKFTENPKLSVLTPDEKLFFLWASSKTNTRGGLNDVASARDPKNILFFLKNRKRIRDSFLDNGFQSNAPTLGVDHKKGPKYLNSGGSVGGGGALMLAAGGNVPGFANGGQADTVPAMLTPGEFVMSKGAVQKHGVGYMKNLNRGRIPGFNRGGVVGRGNVQYKHDGGGVSDGGGVMSIDPTQLQGVLDTFNTSFSTSLDKIVGPFSGMERSLGRIADAFGAMTMTHEFSGNITMSVNIGNKDAIIAEVKKGIMPGISALIKGEMVVGINALKNETIG